MAADAPITPPHRAPSGAAVAEAQHTGLYRSCAYLHRLLTPPPDAVPPVAPGTLAMAVADVAREWDVHVATSEAPGGVLARIADDCPRLVPMIERLRKDHPAVSDGLGSAHGRLDVPVPDVTAAIGELTALLAAIERHRHGGGELLHRAYRVDLGLGD